MSYEVSHFRILEKIGEGGMGVVYKGEDTDLMRPVALKFITRDRPSDEQLVRRFLREARTAASLNHPDICTIYEVGEVAAEDRVVLEHGITLEKGTPFIAMEFLEGETVGEYLHHHAPLSSAEVIRLSLPIAAGLSAAHAHGVVHRDLKPTNIMLTLDGRVKILDFGLAKPACPRDSKTPTRSSSDTESLGITSAGAVVGTVGYMSPEQAAGGLVDSRSDVFSFGVMVYEMATGVLPFRGADRESTIAKILTSTPAPLDKHDPTVPRELTRITQRCLRKDPEERFNDTRDLVVALNDLREQISSADSPRLGSADQKAKVSKPIPSSPDPRRPRLSVRVGRWVGLAVLGSILVLAGVGYGQRSAGFGADLDSRSHRRITFSGGAFNPTISPDGSLIAYTEKLPEGGLSVLVVDLAGGAPLEVFRADTVHTLEWSPDGSNLLLTWGSVKEDGGLEVGTSIVPRLGGTPLWLPYSPLAEWSPSGDRIATAGTLIGEISIVDTHTAATETHRLPSDFASLERLDWSPAKEILILARDDQDKSLLWILDTETGSTTTVHEGVRRVLSARWAPSGSWIYYLIAAGDTNDLVRVSVDSSTDAPGGTPQRVLTGTRASDFSLPISANRVLFTSETSTSNIWLIDRVPGASSGDHVLTQITSGGQVDHSPRFSPDERSIVFARGGSRLTSNIFVLSLDDGVSRQITFLDCANGGPAFSPEGGEIAFASTCGGSKRIWTASLAGPPPRPCTNTVVGDYLAWFPGPEIAFSTPGNKGLSVIEPNSGQMQSLVAEDSQGALYGPQISPDQSTLAVAWNRSSGRGLWLISVDGATQRPIHLDWVLPLKWSHDGESVYAQADSRRLLRVPTAGGKPEFLMEIPFEDALIGDITSDGKRLVVAVRETTSDLWLIDNFDPALDS